MTQREQQYIDLLVQIQQLVQGEEDVIAKMANVAAAIYQACSFWWVGFYRVIGNELVLGPFQGPVACTHIAYGRGVCGTCWQQNQTIIVPDVHQFAGHIACSAASQSEIVVPVRQRGQLVAVLDIDSTYLNDFNTIDQQYLEQISQLIY